MYFVFPVCAFAVVVQLIITTAIAAKTDFNTDFFIFTSCFNVCVYSFLFLDIHLSFIDMQMYREFEYVPNNFNKKLSRNDKFNILLQSQTDILYYFTNQTQKLTIQFIGFICISEIWSLA